MAQTGQIAKKYTGANALEREAKLQTDLESLYSVDFKERLRILEVFECDGIEEAVPNLLNLLKIEDHPWVISKLTKVIGLLGEPYDNEEILDLLIPFLHHQDDRIRANTIEGIGGLKSQRKIPILLEMLIQDESERVKDKAVIAISFDDKLKAVDLLKENLNGDNFELATLALEALRRFDWPEAKKIWQEYKELVEKRKSAWEAKKIFEEQANLDQMIAEISLDSSLDFEISPSSIQEISASAKKTEIQKITQIESAPSKSWKSSDALQLSSEPILPERKKSSDGIIDSRVFPLLTEIRDLIQITQEKLGFGNKILETNTQKLDLAAQNIRNNEEIVLKSVAKIDQLQSEVLNVTKEGIEELQGTIHEFIEQISAEEEGKKESLKSTKRKAVLFGSLCILTLTWAGFQDIAIKKIWVLVQAYEAVSKGKNPQIAKNPLPANPVVSQPDSYNPIDSYEPIQPSGQEPTPISSPAAFVSENPKSSSEPNPVATSSISLPEKKPKSSLPDLPKQTQNPPTQVVQSPSIAENPKVPQNGHHSFTYENEDRYIGDFADFLHSGEGTMFFKNGDTYVGGWKEGLFSGFGTLKFANGSSYTGDFRLGKPHGQGKFIWIGGDRYEGEFKDGVKSGFGRMSYANGNRYTGDFVGGLYSGHGVLELLNGDHYEGEFLDGEIYGIGKYRYADGRLYEGEMHFSKAHGKGILIFPSQEKYDGDFESGNFHGKGVYSFANGSVYEGEWRLGRMSGKGKYTWANKDRYEGQFFEDAPHGKGEIHYADGSFYKGDFVDGLREGSGVFTRRDGYIYSGAWKAGLPHGIGSGKWPDGEEYFGEWKDGREDGNGQYLWPDKKRYTGQWKQGKRHGMGIFVHSDGQVLDGIWENDEFIGKRFTLQTALSKGI